MKKLLLIIGTIVIALILFTLIFGGSYEKTDYRPQGSVNTVEGKTVLVTLLSDDGVEEWSEDELSYVAYAQQTAADYIM
ncbi:MAG: hypothetical protein K6G69_02130 [Lachnospiraceae bacterium]|nr:hypothetical protein [Lachnospiraceae bacterium]